MNEIFSNIPEDRTPRLVPLVEKVSAGIAWFIDRFTWSLLIVSVAGLFTFGVLETMRTDLAIKEIRQEATCEK